MTGQPLARTAVAVVIVAALLAAAAAVERLREARYPGPPVSEATLYMTSGPAVQRLTAGYNALAADLYWIRTIQYYGDVKLRLARSAAGRAQPDSGAGASEYQLLYPLLDLTTSLDPRFNIAYRFGAIFLAEAYPGGAGRPDLAVALLEKGLRDRPDKWEYMQDIGFIDYWWRHDYRAAAQWFDQASRVPGAPWFLRSLAATTLAEGGDRQSSRTMWQAIRQSAEVDWLKSDAERRLLQLDAADRIDDVQRQLTAKTAGAPIGDWPGLIRAGVFPGVPLDPTGTPLVLDAEGHVRLSPASPLYPLPDEPRGLASPAS